MAKSSDKTRDQIKKQGITSDKTRDKSEKQGITSDKTRDNLEKMIDYFKSNTMLLAMGDRKERTYHCQYIFVI